MSSIDTVHWGGRDRISNLEAEVQRIQNGGLLSAIGDITLTSDSDGSSGGDLVFKTSMTTRFTIKSDQVVADSVPLKSYNVASHSTQIVAKPSTDLTDGLFNWKHDSASGYLLHFTSGPNIALAAALIAMGIDNGGTGLLVANKGPTAGYGIHIDNQSTTVAGSFGLFGGQGSANGVLVLLNNNVATHAPILQLQGIDAVAGKLLHVQTATAGVYTTQGYVDSPTGQLIWTALIQAGGGLTATATIDGTASAAGNAALTLHIRSDQTQNVFQVLASDGTTVTTRVNASGRLLAPRLAANTGTSSGIATLAAVGEGSSLATAVLRAASATPGSLLEIQDNAGTTVYSKFDKSGYFMTRKVAAPADADLAAGEMAIWFDSTNGAAKLMVKAKEAGGTVRTGSVALA